MNEKRFHDAHKMQLVFKMSQTHRLHQILIVIYAFNKIKMYKDIIFTCSLIHLCNLASCTEGIHEQVTK